MSSPSNERKSDGQIWKPNSILNFGFNGAYFNYPSIFVAREQSMRLKKVLLFLAFVCTLSMGSAQISDSLSYADTSRSTAASSEQVSSTEIRPNDFQNLFAFSEKKKEATFYWSRFDKKPFLKIRYKTKKAPESEFQYTAPISSDSLRIKLDDLEASETYVWQIGAPTGNLNEHDKYVWSEKQSFTVEEAYGLFSILILLGALGFFIYGMKVMSEGIQRLAGDKMRNILGAMTTNRFAGLFTGFLTTSLIQSSSATTVMIVSFVNAGLLTLRQAIGVIMGANIGTTVTAVLVTVLGFSKFSISAYSLPIIALGFPMLFFKSDRFRSLGEFLIGFGLLFMGLDALKNSVPGLDEGIFVFLEPLTGMGIFSTLIFVFIGTLLTVIVQSSSAAMTLTLVLCGKGLPFDLAAAIVLGENIGTTITANLAAIIGNVHAKRAARAHFIFNVFGVVWMLFVFNFFLRGVSSYIDSIGFVNPMGPDADGQSIQWALTTFHISFNIINSLILIWFVDYIAKTVVRMTPSKGDDDEFRLEYIGRGILSTPELSLLEAKKEIAKFGVIVGRMTGFLEEYLFEKKDKKQKKLMRKIERYEEITDRLQEEIVSYLSRTSEADLSEKSARKVRSMISICNDLERMADVYMQMGNMIRRKIEAKIWFTPEQRNHIRELIASLNEAIEQMNQNLEGDYDHISKSEIERLVHNIKKRRKEIRDDHLSQIGQKDFNVQSSMVYTDLYNSLSRSSDYVMSISEAMAGEIS